MFSVSPIKIGFTYKLSNYSTFIVAYYFVFVQRLDFEGEKLVF